MFVDPNLNTIEVEKKLLSAMMLKDGKVVPEVEQILQPEDFYRVEHRLIYAAMLKVYDEGSPPDILLIEAELSKEGNLQKVKHSYLFALIDCEFTTARATACAKIIKEKARLRALKELGEKLCEDAENHTNTADDIVAATEDALHDNLPNIEEFKSMNEEYSITMSELLNRRKNDDKASGLNTGLFNLNRVIGGLRKTDLIILAARPAMGKTALAMNIAAKVASEQNVLFFSLEMSKKQLIQRMLSSFSQVDATRIFREKLTDEEFQKLLNVENQFCELQLKIYDRGGLTLQQIKSKSRFVKQKYGLDFIVIDYLQLIQASREYRGNRVQEVSEISRGLKALAKELNVPILALSQLSRNVEMRAEKKPQLSDLRDSGSIEQDADIVMFLYREEYYNPDDADNQKIAELSIAKNRNGATGIAYLQFEKKYMLFRDLTRRDVE